MAEEGELQEYQLVNADGELLLSSRGYNGKVTATYTNGDTYQGDFVEGVREGSGTYTYTNKLPEGGEVPITYSGQWLENEKSGIG